MFARLKFAPALLVSVLLVSCGSTSTGPSPIGEAFVGPAQLNLRSELGPRGDAVIAVHHGDRLRILQRRRRFVRVRTDKGAIGWTDLRLLISPEQMDGLRRLAADAAKLPSQGAATVYEPLNMHTEPSRSAPSFGRIMEKQRVDVIAHRVVPRNAKPSITAADVMFEKPAKPVARKAREKKKESSRIGPPPLPKGPGLPPDWLEMSHSALPAPEAPAPPPPPEKPVIMDDWSLVRTADGKAGWSLTRNLDMAIPDEVAQYAEGHRITSYFPLADIRDGDQVKHFWLWTTLSQNSVPYEFDCFRVFVWSLRRHRYETAYIQRNVKGYYPVRTTKSENESGEGAKFSLILDENGQAFRNTYVFNGYRVNLEKKEPYQLPGSADKPKVQVANVEPEPTAQQVSWYSRLTNRVRRWFR